MVDKATEDFSHFPFSLGADEIYHSKNALFSQHARFQQR
jgi:hypothetical protein